ncbi:MULTISPECIES: 3-oxoacyl-ACP synthase [unclassified Streptomyces]|uniref:3-oxoacyl-ACP synthase n=1 Tax=unclassified Streptomyces TaxID=2593676 RepID=UPI001BEB98BB|nr:MULTISPECIES: 3-oxoacyl-ACP synthase [unclassified Streptomyces]MBT2402880.1 3-oxoacyl-ACP synthase [Streptomyces sp. ISL-21]MBT2454864.1 3-oxoacyl-ACP synthase [Streptomyces sp. ISL-86]MBT2612014.1 3-oxoacyl-ACP synthase [Streptomyces sp. ISL-87]
MSLQPSSVPVHLSAPRYVLGEQEADHTTVDNLLERARQFGMPPKAALWGWGTVRRTAKSLETLAVESGRATLDAAGADPAGVDCLILCSTRFPGGPRTHGNFVERVMSGIGLGEGTAFTGLTLGRCTNLLGAIRTAQALVAAGMHRRVLVVTTDRVSDESVRMESFALFSDGAASCLVSAEPLGTQAYELVAGASAQNPGALDWSNEISSDLGRAVNERILEAAGMKLGDIHGVLHPNLYKPVVVLKERQAGFTREQLFLDNIQRFGHCFAADPLINLVDRAAAGAVKPNGHYLLASSVPGVRVGVLLRKLPTADQTTTEGEY